MGLIAPEGMIQALNGSADYKDGYSYVCWTDQGGNERIGQYVHATGVWNKFTLKTGWEVDNHNSPAVLVRPDGKLLTVYMEHNTGNGFKRISTNVHDISAWGAEAALGIGTNYTYPILLDLSGESDKIYLFFREGNSEGIGPGDRMFSTSTDGGATWAVATALIQNATHRPYFRVTRNGTDRLDFVFTDDNSAEIADNNVYHAYYQGGSYFKSDGTGISLPLTPANATLVYDGTADSADQNLEIRIGSDGFPRILFQTLAATMQFARWTGTAWEVHSVTPVVSTGLDAIDGDTLWRYASGNVTKAVTSDGGTTFDVVQTISAPLADGKFVCIPERAHPDMRMYVQDGPQISTYIWDTRLLAYPLGGIASAICQYLIAAWELEEVSGTRLDSHGTNHLTDVNTVTQAAGLVGNAALFTAANSEALTRADSVPLSMADIDFAGSGWIYMTTKPAATVAVITKTVTTGNQRGFQLAWSQSIDRFFFEVSSNGTATANIIANNFAAPATGTWYHVFFAHDSVNNLLILAVNEVAETPTAHTTGVFNNTAAFALGANASGTGAFWNGRDDQNYIWKYYIPTTAERTWLYNAGAGRSYAELIAPVAAATPTIDPNGGSSVDEVEVALETTTPGAVIYYTTDGSEPNSSSTAYTVPFTLTVDTTVKAIAYAEGFIQSAVASADFTITASLTESHNNVVPCYETDSGPNVVECYETETGFVPVRITDAGPNVVPIVITTEGPNRVPIKRFS